MTFFLYAAETEKEADALDDAEDDEGGAPTADSIPMDVSSLENPLQDSSGKIVTNLQAGGDDKNLCLSKAQDATRLREELHALAEELQRRKREGQSDADVESGMEVSRELWGRLRGVTGALSQRLCEQLRLVLEPMVATKLQGDYRSGKRINMRRVIPYIASGFRKDKIWLRRTKPAKRDYQVRSRLLASLRYNGMLRVPDSKVKDLYC